MHKTGREGGGLAAARVAVRWTRLPVGLDVAARRAAATAYLRGVLGAEGADFSTAAGGKPLLPGGPEFSLAHSGDLVLVATSPDAAVGADLELVRPGVIEVARFFTTAEQAELAGLAGAARDRRFFELWTLKEAYRKATGEGIAGPGMLLGPPAGGWTVDRPALPAGYLGAVVALAAAAVFTVTQDAARRSSH